MHALHPLSHLLGCLCSLVRLSSEEVRIFLSCLRNHSFCGKSLANRRFRASPRWHRIGPACFMQYGSYITVPIMMAEVNPTYLLFYLALTVYARFPSDEASRRMACMSNFRFGPDEGFLLLFMAGSIAIDSYSLSLPLCSHQRLPAS